MIHAASNPKTTIFTTAISHCGPFFCSIIIEAAVRNKETRRHQRDKAQCALKITFNNTLVMHYCSRGFGTEHEMLLEKLNLPTHKQKGTHSHIVELWNGWGIDSISHISQGG